MSPLEPFRDAAAAEALAREIRAIAPERPLRIMEICGGQTRTIRKWRLRELLPPSIRLVSGPGCPVCVTPVSYIDQAVALCAIPDVDVFTFGDLVRVPGTRCTLERARAEGGRVHVVYSPREALEHARRNPSSRAVFLAIGFETTMPAFCLPRLEAAQEGRGNFSVLLSAKRVPPVMEVLLRGDAPLDGFVAPGHVTSVIGSDAYDDLCHRYGKPMVVGGFEPVDLLVAIRDLVRMIADGRGGGANAYRRASRPEGNRRALHLIDELLEPCDEELRGLGTVAGGGSRLRAGYEAFDARRVHRLPETAGREPPGCRCGQILSGTAEPEECPLFGRKCVPENPVGACMVSSEGACNAAWTYGGEHAG